MKASQHVHSPASEIPFIAEKTDIVVAPSIIFGDNPNP